MMNTVQAAATRSKPHEALKEMRNFLSAESKIFHKDAESQPRNLVRQHLPR
jgi:hypothetical protein